MTMHSLSANIDLSAIDVLIVHQEDFQAIYEEYRGWLEENDQHYLVFLSDSSQDLTRFVFEQNNEELFRRQVRFYCLDPHREEEIFRQIAWEFLYLKSHFLFDPAMGSRSKEVFSKLSYFQSAVHLLASDSADFGIRVFENFLHSAGCWTKMKRGFDLYQKFKGVPAIICGAGPSLDRDLLELKGLKDKALIFAGGTAINILSKHHIRPHFGAMMDPSAMTEPCIEDVPIFVQSRTSCSFLSQHEEQLIWMRGSGNHLIEDYLMDELQIFTPVFDAGWCVGNFCLSLAYVLGCNPIIMVGMDFASNKGSVYASNYGNLSDRDFIPKINQKGEEVMTKMDFLMAADWVERFAAKHQECTIINATFAGLGFAGIEELSLKEVRMRYLQQQEDIVGRVFAEVMSLSSVCDNEYRLRDGIYHIVQSLKNAAAYCDQILLMLEASFPNLPENTGEFHLLEHQLEEEIAFQKIVTPVWNIWKHVLVRNHPYDPHWDFGRYINRLLFYKNIIEAHISKIKTIENS